MSRPSLVETFSDGQPFDVLGHAFHPIRVRGHSDDSHCLLSEVSGRRCVFTGDTIFYGGVLGVINRPDSGMQGYRCDIKKLSNLNVEGLFPGHGLFTLWCGQAHIDLAIEQAHKGFLPRQIGQWDIMFWGLDETRAERTARAVPKLGISSVLSNLDVQSDLIGARTPAHVENAVECLGGMEKALIEEVNQWT